MRNHRSAQKEADSLCGPTCPAVDEAFDRLAEALREMVAPSLSEAVEKAIDECCERVKEFGTLRLRDALIDACSDKQEAESERKDALAAIARLEGEIAQLRYELSQAQREAA